MLTIDEIYLGDCLKLMKEIDDKSVDMILCDLPYGTTQNKWDSTLPLYELWEHYRRIIRDKSMIVLTASQPFTSTLVVSNLEMFKYEWIWKKTKASNFLNAKIEPLKEHESVLVFGMKRTYFPQGLIPYGKIRSRKSKKGTSENYGDYRQENFSEFTNYPRTILEFPLDKPCGHSTQKPIALFEYLIKTYTTEGMTVLDNCIGSGTTAIAAINTNRHFIGMEIEQKYYSLACERVCKHLMEAG